MKETRDYELKSFKTDIDLRAYAAGRGYAIDKRESWRGSSVMRHASGDKIIIKRDHDGHYVYFSVRDDRDNGSIIDFVQKRGGGSLGAVRQTLRPWLGKAATDIPAFPALGKTTKDRFEVEMFFRRMQDAPDHPYLTGERAIPASLLSSERFAGRVRIDARGNAIFPHFDAEGLCGYEIKNKDYTGFAKGGEKGLWFSRTDSGDRTLVIAEGAIDALSHAAIFPAPDARYASLGGQANAKQPSLIMAAASKMPEGSTILAAMDSDSNGAKLAELLHQAVQRTNRPDLTFTLHTPENAKDWNDALRTQTPSFPTALPLAQDRS